MITPENALYRAAALCSRCEQAEADIRKKLKTWGITSSDAEKIIARLYEGNYLNERRYAEAFALDKFRFNGWGRTKISFSMRQKGISQDSIAEALQEIDETEYRMKLREILQSKFHTLHDKEHQLQRASLFRFAASRGFEPALISQEVSLLLKNLDDDGFCMEDYIDDVL